MQITQNRQVTSFNSVPEILVPKRSEDQLLPSKAPTARPAVSPHPTPPAPQPEGVHVAQPWSFKAPNYGKWERVDVSYLERNGYAGVYFDRLRDAQHIPPQSAAGEYRDYCCGPNSLARAAILLGRNVGDVNALYRNFKYNGIGPWRFGPDPLQMKEALEKNGAFHGIAVGALRVDRWNDFMKHLDWHVAQAKTPFLALLVHSQTSMHWVNVVALSPDRQYCVILDTSGALFRVSLEELHAELDKDKTLAPVLSKLNGVRFWP